MPLTIFTKLSALDVWQDSEYASADFIVFRKIILKEST